MSARNPWILGSFRRDFLFLTLPGLVAIALSIFLREQPQWAFRGLVVYLVYTWIDTGHVYTTMWRTYFRRQELSAARLVYIATPILFFSLFAAWAWFAWPGLWGVVVYGTLFHNIRQLWGFLKWYQKLEGRSDAASSFFFHALVLLPVAAYHFNPQRAPGYYYFNQGEVMHWPQPDLYILCVGLYAATLLVWMLHEIQLWRAGSKEPGRLLGLVTAMILYGYGPLFGRSFGEVILPLIASHGIAYMAVMGQTTDRLGHTRWKGFGTLMLVMVGTAFVFGFVESGMQGYFNGSERGYLERPHDWGLAVATGLWLGPLYSHYLFDGFLWRKAHRDSAVVFARADSGRQ